MSATLSARASAAAGAIVRTAAAAACLLVAGLAVGCGTPNAALPAPQLGDTTTAIGPPPRAQQRDPVPRPPEGRRNLAAVDPPLPVPGDTLDAQLFRVGGRVLTAADLGDFVLRYFPERADEALSQLVEELLVGVESEREGVVVGADEVATRAEVYLEQRRRAVRVEFGTDADFERLLLARYGRTVEQYRSDAERLARAALLRDLLVRLDQLRHDSVDVRILVFRSEEGARDSLERLVDGADIARLAERRGLDAPAAPPPLTAADVPDADVFAALRAAPRGGVVGPLPFRAGRPGEERTWWRVVKVVGSWDGTAEPWDALRERIISNGELVGGPVRPAEVLAWRARVLSRLPVERRDAAGALVRWLGSE